MTKRLVDIDDGMLEAARGALRTTTIKDTVHEALRHVAATRSEELERAIAVLAEARLDDRDAAWR